MEYNASDTSLRSLHTALVTSLLTNFRFQYRTPYRTNNYERKFVESSIMTVSSTNVKLDTAHICIFNRHREKLHTLTGAIRHV